MHPGLSKKHGAQIMVVTCYNMCVWKKVDENYDHILKKKR
jgi:hypothetical protein